MALREDQDVDRAECDEQHGIMCIASATIVSQKLYPSPKTSRAKMLTKAAKSMQRMRGVQNNRRPTGCLIVFPSI
jgi:hypothetical protein